jgi:hypothetical protein
MADPRLNGDVIMLSIEQLAGGLALEKDLVLPAQPNDPEMRESVSVWLYDDEGRFAFPRMGIEAEASSWDNRRVQGNFCFANGRVLNGAGMGAAHPSTGCDGRPTTLGAGAISFKCIEPFKRWSMHWKGPALDGTIDQQINGGFGSAGEAEVELDAEMEMVTPAWVQENNADTSGMSELEKANAGAMGLGYRFEHHFLATGTFKVGGKAFDFTGRGTRIHRQSIRSLTGFFGHSWLSAVFPNGDAFGALAYPPREGSNGEYSYNDAVIYKDGRLIKARIVEAPFLRSIVPTADPITLVLESDLGLTTIEGRTALSTFRIGNPDIGGLNLQQGGALFQWDGQQAYGMVERSTHETLTTIGA